MFGHEIIESYDTENFGPYYYGYLVVSDSVTIAYYIILYADVYCPIPLRSYSLVKKSPPESCVWGYRVSLKGDEVYLKNAGLYLPLFS